jgi:hypothetical protein
MSIAVLLPLMIHELHLPPQLLCASGRTRMLKHGLHFVITKDLPAAGDKLVRGRFASVTH